MRFYRGIAVPAEAEADVTARIRSRGLSAGEGRWSIQADYLRPQLEELWRLPVVTYASTRSAAETPPWICACADEAGACYYACRHNLSRENNTPLLITFDADLADVVVDGRDFLYALFQLGDPKRARPVAEVLFGQGILRYIDRAWSTDEQEQRIAICDLAVQDEAVVKAHAENKIVIGGRYRTQFRNAYLVRLPIIPERIVDVRAIAIDTPIPDVELTLDSIRG